MADTNASQDPTACPVDHKSREAWLQQARAAQSSQQALPPDHPPVAAPAAGGKNASGSAAEESCPVDHKAREAWAQQARAAAVPPQAAQASTIPPPPPPTTTGTQTSSWTSGIFSYLPFGGGSSSSSSSASASSSREAAAPGAQSGNSKLDTNRIISSIPRSSQPGAAGATPANKEQETGADAKSGNWIYPSEKMFFEAMKRKGHDPQSTDMQTIVPIHNAVNEKAWAQIKEWEAPYLKGTSCDGPRLSSFSGLSSNISPKARINTWLGYQAPFDRHDWVVDRCGQEIEYIIDFYAGRAQGDGRPSFYLDVRPKLNSWEGVKMRAMKGLGIM